MSSWAAIVVAVVGAGGPLMWLMTRFDRRNTDQHAANMTVLKSIQDRVTEVRDDVKTIDHRLHRHIEWHLSEED